jgi:hypothetical protein
MLHAACPTLFVVLYAMFHVVLFRQAIVYKGRSRDTAWFSIIDREWPALRTAFNLWLTPENFDADGRQREGLSSLMKLRERKACATDEEQAIGAEKRG